MATGKRARAAQAAAKAAGVDISKDIKAAGKAISKSELAAINKKITKAGGTAVDFATTAKGFQAPVADNNTVTETYDDYLKRQAEANKAQDRINWKEFFRTTLTEWGVPQ
jgi:hypothetical protein